MKNKLKQLWNWLCFYKKTVVENKIGYPYILQYENTSEVDAEAVLFGYNDNFGTENFGNPSSVKITDLQGSNYQRLLGQTCMNKDTIYKWRFQSQNLDQLQVSLKPKGLNANGSNFQDSPINLSVLKHPNQFQNTILEIIRPFKIDGGRYITFELKGLTKFCISMFPAIQITKQIIVERNWLIFVKQISVKIKDYLFSTTKNEIKSLKAEIEQLKMFISHQAQAIRDIENILISKHDSTTDKNEETDKAEFNPLKPE